MEGKRWRNWILAIVGTLLAIGIVMIDSTSAIKAGEAGDASLFLRRQIVWSIIALGALVIAWHTDYHSLARYSPHLMIGVLVPTAVAAAEHNVWTNRLDSRKASYDWIKKNVPRDQAILVDAYGPILQPNAATVSRLQRLEWIVRPQITWVCLPRS